MKKELFDKIKDKSKSENKVRYPTSADNIKTLEDVILVLKFLLEELEKK